MSSVGHSVASGGQTVLIDGHKVAIVGQLVTLGGQVVAEGLVSRDTSWARDVAKSGVNGFPWQAQDVSGQVSAGRPRQFRRQLSHLY